MKVLTHITHIMLFSADITTVTVKAERTLNEIRQLRTQCRKSAKRVIAKLFAIPLLESPAPHIDLGHMQRL